MTLKPKSKVAETCGCSGSALRQKVLEAIGNGQGRRILKAVGTPPSDHLIVTSSAPNLCYEN